MKWKNSLLCILLLFCACQKGEGPKESGGEFVPPTGAKTSVPPMTQSIDTVETASTDQPPVTQVPKTLGTETKPPKTEESLIITIVYDNNAYDRRLTTAWGFAALVEYHGHTILFDTGDDSSTLLNNMQILEIDPTRVEHIMFSHIHGDHVGGIEGLFSEGVQAPVYVIPSFPEDFKDLASQKVEVFETKPGQIIIDEFYTTGEMGGRIPEQALVIKTEGGLVIITGCAHPGVVNMVEQAKSLLGGEVLLVMGGFHLGGRSTYSLGRIINDFRTLGVKSVAPCHCTGDQAIQMFAAAYGDDFIKAGVGKIIVIHP